MIYQCEVNVAIYTYFSPTGVAFCEMLLLLEVFHRNLLLNLEGLPHDLLCTSV